MCLKFSRTPFLVLIIGIYLELSIKTGICDDSQLVSKQSQTIPHRHVHHWTGWDDWLSSSRAEKQQHDNYHYNAMTHSHGPLSPAEQERQRKRASSRNQQNSVTAQGKSSQIRSSKNTTATNKTGLDNPDEGGVSMADLKNLKDTAVNLASSVINQFMERWSFSPSSSRNELDSHRNGRGIYLDNLDRPDGPNVGKPEKEARRGVVDWLSRLIGVQGKTLGEFLREYQVHVLYDLAFTFFKWIFFLYAGLLIP